MNEKYLERHELKRHGTVASQHCVAGTVCGDGCCAGSRLNSRLDYSTVSPTVSTGVGIVLHPEALVAHRDAHRFAGGDRFGVVAMARSALVAQVNSGDRVVEWMFNPLANSAYARTSEAGSFVGDDDMLMTVMNGNEAAAYPVRQMAYHHVVQDMVGGLPIVATY